MGTQHTQGREWWDDSGFWEAAQDAPSAAPSKQEHGCCADKACTDKTCMALPTGKTCGDCRNVRHCMAFYARKQTDTSCDFFPRRFAERAAITPTPGEPTP